MNKVNMNFEREVLLKEYDKVSQEIKLYISTSEKLFGIGLLILGFGVTYGLKEDIKLILLILPFGGYGVYFWSIYLLTILFSLGGYRKSMEEKINTLIGHKILLWETEIFPKRAPFKFTVTILSILLCGILIFTVGISLKVAFQSYGFPGLVILVVINLIFVGCLLVSLKKMKDASNKIYEFTRAQGNSGN